MLKPIFKVGDKVWQVAQDPVMGATSEPVPITGAAKELFPGIIVKIISQKKIYVQWRHDKQLYRWSNDTLMKLEEPNDILKEMVQ